MRYTDEQRAILALCRKYSKVHCSFDTDNGIPVAVLYIKPNWDRDDLVPYSEVESWLKKHTTLKQVGRPKGSIRPSKRVKKTITLTPETWAKVEEIKKQQGLKYASHAIGLAVEAFSKNKTAYEIQSQIGNDCCICKHVEYCPNAKWDNDKLNTCDKWQISEGGE